ncbi:MAG: COX15/CtaA family protein [Actinobacteria bacterium]|nr:COX15/CtaA family protein [Actinomycetota bacterium]
MDRFRKLAISSTVATFILVAIGGVVRATKSGLGCGTDWPDCSGRIIPLLNSRPVVIEFSHRIMASIVLLLLGALALLAFRHYRQAPRILWPSVAAFGLVIVQALLGAVVVVLELHAVSVVLHLATAMTLVGVLVYLVAASSPVGGPTPPRFDRSISKQASVTATAVLLLLLSGSYVTGRDAGLVFPDWPLMNGQLVPDLSIGPYAIHFAHRALAALAGVFVFLTSARVMKRKGDMPVAYRLAHVLAGGFALQVVIGAANVWTQLNPIAVSLHLIVGTVLWASLVGIAVVAHPAITGSGAQAPSAHRRPVLESGAA